MKNTDKALTRADLNQAIYSKSLILPAVESLKKITLKSCNEDLASYSEIQAFTHWLGSFLICADETICQAQADYDNRDQGLINRAHRRLSEIPNDLLRAEFELKNLAGNYQMKVAELKRQGGFSDSEIAHIVQNPQPEIYRYTAIVAELKAEQALISGFLTDYPRYAVGLLAGTKVQISV